MTKLVICFPVFCIVSKNTKRGSFYSSGCSCFSVSVLDRRVCYPLVDAAVFSLGQLHSSFLFPILIRVLGLLNVALMHVKVYSFATRGTFIPTADMIAFFPSHKDFSAMGAFPPCLTDRWVLRTARFPILCFATMEFQTGGSIEDTATVIANVGS